MTGARIHDAGIAVNKKLEQHNSVENEEN
jgi:hypothetical protein